MDGGDLDEFRLVRPLGRGGMGEVYLGHDTVLDRPVAIKLIGSRNPDAASRERFVIEARAIARLSHPNVVTIFRVGTTGDGRPFLVQELIRGRSLDRIARPVAPRQLCELAVGIARGLDAAHRRGILHRDVKPANVMLDEQDTVRLLDFGLAKLTAIEAPAVGVIRDAPSPAGGVVTRERKPDDLDVTRDPEMPSERQPSALAIAETGVQGSPAPTSHTRAGTVLGTPRYTPPELWRSEPATVRSDLYSFGIMLYELATGVPPYPQTDAGELERAILAGGARPVDELAPELPPIVARLIMRCIAVDPSARPASAAEVVHELEAVLVDAPALPAGNPYRGLRAFEAEHRGLFFGRGTDISVLVDRLRSESLLVVAGDSGIGKSSVCHAGVAPAVLAGALADRRRWRVVTIVPGRRPWDALRDALAIDGGDPRDRTLDVIRRARPSEADGILVVVDQLEELVTLAGPDQAARVAEAIAAIADGVPGMKALLSVRGDFLTRVAALPELGPSLTRGLHLLRVLGAEDLREAVIGPARANGVVFENETMVEQLVGAVAGNPGALPLLQFTLAELWNRRDAERRIIPERALVAIGGVEGGLAGHADAVLLELGAAQRAAARRIVLRLVTDAHTRAVRDRNELVDGDEAAAALEALVRGRLVIARDTIDGTPSYELAHEALIRGWGTLRDWLDAAAGQHAMRNRLLARAAEWQRLERRGDLLWSRSQLDEARDLADLTAVEHEFIAMSRRQLRRRRATRIASIAALPMIALAIWIGLRIDAARRRDRAIDARVQAASAHRARADALAAVAASARQSAFNRFDANANNDGERYWTTARKLAAEAHAGYTAAAAELDAALLLDPGAVRSHLTTTLAARLRLAEAQRDRSLAGDLLSRLRTLAPAYVSTLRANGRLICELDRTARIAVHPRRDELGATIAGAFDANAIATTNGKALDVELAPGSYVIVVTSSDGVTVRDPLVIDPGEHLTRRLALPAARTIPAGFIYVPPGSFLFGSDDDEAFRRTFLRAPPMHRVSSGAYLIARTEVTFAQWMEYLRASSDVERELRRPRMPAGTASVNLEGGPGGFTLVLAPSEHAFRAREGELLTYPGRAIRQRVRWERLPVSGISWADALEYMAWLDRTGRVPGARMCTAYEWERAARGADGRRFPHGDVLTGDQASIDETYGRVSDAYGPDEVGSFPASDSPFGVSDLAGNANELIRGTGDKPVLKGGSWYFGTVSAHAANSTPGEVATRSARIGLRVCADAPSAR